MVFLPGFGCLYTDVSYDGGTLVLSLAPEGSMDAMTYQHSRYVTLPPTPAIFTQLYRVSLSHLTVREAFSSSILQASLSPQEGNKSLIWCHELQLYSMTSKPLCLLAQQDINKWCCKVNVNRRPQTVIFVNQSMMDELGLILFSKNNQSLYKGFVETLIIIRLKCLLQQKKTVQDVSV